MKELVQLSIALKTLGYHNLSQSILKIGQQTRKTNLQKIEISSSKILSDPNNPSSATKGYKLTITPIVDGQKGQSQTIDYLLGGGVKLLPQGDKNPQSILDNIIGGLVVLGAIIFIWNSTPKKNKEGFYSASGCGCGAK